MGNKGLLSPLVRKALFCTVLLVLASSFASAHVIPKPCDFVTGGGFVRTDQHANANFGFVAGCKNHHFYGNLNFLDHGTGLHVKSIDVVSYTMVVGNAVRRDFCGTAKTNQFGTVKYHVTVSDFGEPGINKDRFGISLSNGYKVMSRYIRGGNIQLHKPNPSNTPPSTFVDCKTLAPSVLQ